MTPEALNRLTRQLREMTRTCYLCKQERPDKFISVFVKKDDTLPGFTQNIRYCNDNPDCKEKAKDFSFL